GWGTQIGVLCLYLGAVMVLLVAALGSGRIPWPRADRPDWLPGISDVFNVMFWVFVIGSFAVPFALADQRGARVRYGLLTLFGWTRYLLDGQQWLILVVAALFGETLGLGGLGWVERYILKLAADGD